MGIKEQHQTTKTHTHKAKRKREEGAICIKILHPISRPKEDGIVLTEEIARSCSPEYRKKQTKADLDSRFRGWKQWGWNLKDYLQVHPGYRLASHNTIPLPPRTGTET